MTSIVIALALLGPLPQLQSAERAPMRCDVYIVAQWTDDGELVLPPGRKDRCTHVDRRLRRGIK